MSNTPKVKPLSKDKIIQALSDQNARLLEDNTVLTEALQKERTGDIKLPQAPSVGQYNRIVDWCNKIKNYYDSSVDAPVKEPVESTNLPQDTESASHA